MHELREAIHALENTNGAFSHSWAEVAEQWDDDAKRYFEAEFVRAFLSETPALATQARTLAEIFEQARSEID